MYFNRNLLGTTIVVAFHLKLSLKLDLLKRVRCFIVKIKDILSRKALYKYLISIPLRYQTTTLMAKGIGRSLFYPVLVHFQQSTSCYIFFPQLLDH